MQELQAVDGGGDDGAAGMTGGGDGAGDVDEMHHRAAQDEAERVRVVRQNDLNRLGRGFRGPLGWRRRLRALRG